MWVLIYFWKVLFLSWTRLLFSWTYFLPFLSSLNFFCCSLLFVLFFLLTRPQEECWGVCDVVESFKNSFFTAQDLLKQVLDKRHVFLSITQLTPYNVSSELNEAGQRWVVSTRVSEIRLSETGFTSKVSCMLF